MLVRSHWRFKSSRRCPSSVMVPAEMAYQRSSMPKMVLLPEPLAPTSAVVLSDGMSRSRPCSTGTPGRDGYENLTPRSLMSPVKSAMRVPSAESESMADLRSMMANRSCAAAVALEMAMVWGAICVSACAATSTAKMTVTTVPGCWISPVENMRMPCQKATA